MKQELLSFALLVLLLSVVLILAVCQPQEHGHETVTDTDDSYSVKKNMSAVSPVGAVVGAFVLPHGGIAFDPKHFNTTVTTW